MSSFQQQEYVCMHVFVPTISMTFIRYSIVVSVSSLHFISADPRRALSTPSAFNFSTLNTPTFLIFVPLPRFFVYLVVPIFTNFRLNVSLHLTLLRFVSHISDSLSVCLSASNFFAFPHKWAFIHMYVYMCECVSMCKCFQVINHTISWIHQPPTTIHRQQQSDKRTEQTYSWYNSQWLTITQRNTKEMGRQTAVQKLHLQQQ